MEFENEVKESKSEIQRFLEELKNSNIGIENYKKYFEKVKNTDTIIVTTIQSLSREHFDYKEDYKKLTRNRRFEESLEEGYISKDVYELAKNMNRTLTEAYSWRTLQGEMYNIIMTKMFDVLDDTKALDIKRDALQEMREMEKTRQELYLTQMESMGNLFREVVNNKIKHYDEKLFHLIKNNVEENRKERVDMFNCFETIMNNNKDVINNNTRKEIKEILSNALKNQKEVLEEETDNDNDYSDLDEDIDENEKKEREIDKEILRRREILKKDPFAGISDKVEGRYYTREEEKYRQKKIKESDKLNKILREKGITDAEYIMSDPNDERFKIDSDDDEDEDDDDDSFAKKKKKKVKKK